MARKKPVKGAKTQLNVIDKILERKEDIVAWANEGLSISQIADNLGIGRSTLYKYQRESEEFKQIIDEAKRTKVFHVENALFKSALGFHVQEEKTIKDASGSIIRKEVTKKYIPPSVSAQIFALKNLMSDKYKDRQDIHAVQEIAMQDNSLIEALTYSVEKAWGDSEVENGKGTTAKGE